MLILPQCGGIVRKKLRWIRYLEENAVPPSLLHEDDSHENQDHQKHLQKPDQFFKTNEMKVLT